MLPSPDDSAGARILVVDDDEAIAALVSEFLRKHGYAVSVAADAVQMQARIAEAAPDLIVLDLMLPGEDGLSICRRLAGEGAAIIMMSALGEETDRIIGLEVGADDYLPKPCSPRELLARVRAVLRRRRSAPADAAAARTLSFAGWRLDVVRRDLRTPAGQPVPLSSGEFTLLRAFVERPFRVLSRDQLLDMTRGADAESYDRAIDVQVSRLRRKLADHDNAELIRTIRSEGYCFVADVRSP